MSTHAPSPTAQRIWLGLGLLLLVLFLYYVRDTLPPFLIAFAAAALLDPLLDRMQRRGWSRVGAAAVVFVLFLLVFAGVALVLIPAAVGQASEFGRNVPAYYAGLLKRLDVLLASQQPLLSRLGLEGLPTTSQGLIKEYEGQIQRVLQTLLSRLLQFFAGSVSKLAWVAIIPIATFYLLLEIDPLRARVAYLVPLRHRTRFIEMSERVGAVFSGYVRGLIIVCSGYAVVNFLVLALLFRLPYALMIGLVAGVMYAVPYVGAVATIAVGGLVAASTQHTVGYVIGVVVTMLVINQVFDQVITPRIVGGLVGLNPVVSLFALTAGGELFGLPGMILAVPVAASIKVVLTSLWPQLSEPLPSTTGMEPVTAKVLTLGGAETRGSARAATPEAGSAAEPSAAIVPQPAAANSAHTQTAVVPSAPTVSVQTQGLTPDPPPASPERSKRRR